jgi:hypothetical protein
VKEGEVLRLFLPYGRVVKSDFCWHTAGPRKGEPRGYAFLEYATTEEASRAIAALDGRELRGRRLQVRYVKEQEAQPSDPRAFLSKARAKASARASGKTRPASPAPASAHGNAGAASAVRPPGPGAAGGKGGGGGGGGAGRGEEEEETREESALEAKIRALKAMLQQPGGR